MSSSRPQTRSETRNANGLSGSQFLSRVTGNGHESSEHSDDDYHAESEVDQLEADLKQPAKRKRGPGRRSSVRHNHCTYNGCVVALTVEEKERELVRCKLHREKGNEYAQRYRNNKKQKLLSFDSTTQSAPDITANNLDTFSDGIINNIAAALYLKKGLLIHKETDVKSEGLTPNLQGSSFVKKLGLALETWTPGVSMSIDYLPTEDCQSSIAYMKVYKCNCAQPPAEPLDNSEHPETGSGCNGRITVLVIELMSGVHHITFDISHRPL